MPHIVGLNTGNKVEFETVDFVKFDKVDRMSNLVKRTFKIQLIFLRQKSPAFNKVDRVGHVQLWRQCQPQQSVALTLSPVCMDQRQNRSFVNINEDLLHTHFCNR